MAELSSSEYRLPPNLNTVREQVGVEGLTLSEYSR